jgi:dolichyl-diphosphooligosaccharide---protein glycosyltransferase
MAAAIAVDPLFRGTTGKNTRGLLRIIILCTIAAAAVSARLFSVIRTPFVPLVVLCQTNELGY